MFSALVEGKWCFRPFVFSKFSALAFCRNWDVLGHNVDNNQGQLRRENLDHKFLLEFMQSAGAFLRRAKP